MSPLAKFVQPWIRLKNWRDHRAEPGTQWRAKTILFLDFSSSLSSAEIRTCSSRDTKLRVVYILILFLSLLWLSLNDRRLNSVKAQLKHDDERVTRTQQKRRKNVFRSKCFLSIELCLSTQLWRMNTWRVARLDLKCVVSTSQKIYGSTVADCQ